MRFLAAIDCTWSDWTIWSECSDKCSDGINTRTRQIESPAMYNGTCEGTHQEARPCNNMKALEQVIASLQNNNTELQEENRKLKEKLNAIESKDTGSFILKDPHVYRNNLYKTLDTWGPNFNIKFDIILNKIPPKNEILMLEKNTYMQKILKNQIFQRFCKKRNLMLQKLQ